MTRNDLRNIAIVAKGHFDGRLADFLEGECLNQCRVTHRLADCDVLNAGNTDDIADSCGVTGDTFQAVKLIEGDNFASVTGVRVVIVTDGDFLTGMNGTTGNPSDCDTADIVVVVD